MRKCVDREQTPCAEAQADIRHGAERKRDEWPAESRRLRFALDSARIGDWDMDLATGKILGSLEYARCFGLRELTDWTFDRFLSRIHPEDRAGIEHLVREATQRQEEWHFECRVVWPDASVHWIEGHGVVYGERDGKERRAAGIARDISERKLAEEARSRETNERLRKLTGHLERVLENERVRIARELHDDLGSTLAGAKWAMAMAINRAESAGSPPDAQLSQALQLLDSAVDTMRRIVIDLRPSVLDQLGLWAAIQWYADLIEERSGLRCHVSLSAETVKYQLDSDRSTAVFRVVQEALTNVVLHARAKRVDIQVDCSSDGLAIEVRDDGVGIGDEALLSDESWGLVGMQQRASRFGGEIRIAGISGKGTTVTLRMPM